MTREEMLAELDWQLASRGYTKSERMRQLVAALASPQEVAPAEDVVRAAEQPLNEYDIAALKLMAGEPQDVFDGWGAALSACLGHLKGVGLAKLATTGKGLEYTITDKGRTALASAATVPGATNG